MIWAESNMAEKKEEEYGAGTKINRRSSGHRRYHTSFFGDVGGCWRDVRRRVREAEEELNERAETACYDLTV